MATAFTLSINAAAANKVAMAAALALVTDTTRRVLNRATVLTPVDQGRLRAGNQMRVTQAGHRVMGEVFNDTAYAKAVHDGSRAHTIHPKPQTITIKPKNGQFLRFEVGGRVVYAKQVRTQKPLRFVIGGRVVYAARVNMPARKGRPWLYRALVEIAAPQGYVVTKL